MAKRKVGLLAQVLAITDQLSLEEIKTLSDTVYLKLLAEKKMSKSESKPERKPSQKRKAGKDNSDDNPPFAGLVCAACGKPFGDNDHHLESRPTYHPFQSAGEASKGADA